MSVKIVNVVTKRQLRDFIDFPYTLFKGVENWVPPLRGDEFDTFNRKRNGAYEFCDSSLYLAYKDGKIVGRVAAIINFKANELWNEKVVRFGWLDFIEDTEVLKALMEQVVNWGKAMGCDTAKGPLGFTDMDKEGLLIEGYENLSPFTCLYNFPYYDKLLSEAGFSKDVDWIQKIAFVDEPTLPMFEYADVIESRFGIHIYEGKTTRELARKYGKSIFHMYNEAFAPLFQFTPLTNKQIDRYLQTYVPILSPDFVAICLDSKGNPVGFAFCVPSLAKAVRKCKGRLFPFGWFHILKALHKNDEIEALMIGILPEYQGKGASVLMFKYLHERAYKFGIRKMILNPQLEENFKVHSLFEQYRTEPYMRRRSYKKTI